jgi:hypothetical protein
VSLASEVRKLPRLSVRSSGASSRP